MSTSSSVSLADLLATHAAHLELLPTNKIRCKVTQHELPPRADAVTQHLQGQKFKKALEWYTRDYSEYLPYIVPHRKDPRKLFCVLTKQPLNKIPAEVKKHVSGKRFLKLKAEHEAEAAKKAQRAAAKKAAATKGRKSDAGNEEDDDEGEFWVSVARLLRL